MTRSILFVIAVASALSACSKNEPAATAAPPAASAATAAPQSAPAAPTAPAAPAMVQAAPVAPAAPAQAQPAPVAQAAAPVFQAVPAAPVAPTAPARAAQNVGKVLQIQNGGGYSYAEVETASGMKVWIAGSQLELKPGASVEWGDFAIMRNFNAKSLNRTFPEILFVNRWGPVGAATVATPAHGTFPQPPAPGMAGPSDSGVVKSVANAGGYSYIEVDRGGKTVWVAANETPMKAGDKVQWQGGTEMSNFTAKSIGRTFDKITFATGVNVVK